jgi:hypothetical protein
LATKPITDPASLAKPTTMLGRFGVDFQERPAIRDQLDRLPHVVRLIARHGHQRVQRVRVVARVVGDRLVRRVLGVVRRQIGEQLARELERAVLVVGHEVRDTGARGVHVGAAERFDVDFLAGDGANHVGAGDEHVAPAPNHDDKVRQPGE